MYGIIINHSDGARVYLRSQDIGCYTDGKLMACGDWRTTRKKHLAASFHTSDRAAEWVSDLHQKEIHCRHKGVAFAEVVYFRPKKPIRAEKTHMGNNL